MAAKKLTLTIITPTQTRLATQAERVILRCTNGDIGILPGHDARAMTLTDGVLRILNEKEEKTLPLSGGLAAIENDVVTILTND